MEYETRTGMKDARDLAIALLPGGAAYGFAKELIEDGKTADEERFPETKQSLLTKIGKSLAAAIVTAPIEFMSAAILYGTIAGGGHRPGLGFAVPAYLLMRALPCLRALER